MAQSGFTPILIYGSGTTGNTPTAGNLTTSASGAELAINYFDGKLFYKDNAGVVQVLATKATGSIGGSNTQVQYNSSGALAGSANMTFNGTTLSVNGLTVSGTSTLSALTASTALALNASKEVVSVTNTGTGNNVLATSPTLVTPVLGTPTSVTLTNATGLPLSTGVTGTLATTNGGTGLTSFTSGGVVYASSTSALATGSALTFDGTNLGVGVASPGQLIDGTAANPRLRLTATSTGYAASQFANSSGASYFGRDNSAGSFFGIANGTVVYSSTNDPIGFFLGTNEQMRLTSSGLEVKQSQLIGYSSYAGIGTNGLAVAGNVGIGTSSPLYRFAVVGATSDATPVANFRGYASGNDGDRTAILRFTSSTDLNWAVARYDAWSHLWHTNGSLKATLDSSGNLGLGVTPSAWGLLKAMDVSSSGSFFGYTAQAGLSNNAFFDGSNWKYKNTAAAAFFRANAAAFEWHTAPSGTAGNAISFTQAMTLDASGNLMVGGTNNDPFSRAFTGTRTVLGNNSGETGLTFRSGTGTTSYLEMGSGSTFLFSLSCNASSTQLQTTTAVPLIFSTNSGERARISSDGTFRVKGAGTAGSTDAFQVSGSAPADAARITSGGELLVGTTTAYGRVVGSGIGAPGMVGICDTVSIEAIGAWNKATSGDNTFINFGTEAAFTLRGSITYNRAGGLVAYNVTSDYRAKDILGPVANPGATIDALKVYEGQMKGATQPRPMLVAHEAQEHAPYAVSGVKDEVNEDGTPKFQQMDVSSLVPLLIAEIQSLRARVAALEA